MYIHVHHILTEINAIFVCIHNFNANMYYFEFLWFLLKPNQQQVPQMCFRITKQFKELLAANSHFPVPLQPCSLTLNLDGCKLQIR